MWDSGLSNLSILNAWFLRSELILWNNLWGEREGGVSEGCKERSGLFKFRRLGEVNSLLPSPVGQYNRGWYCHAADDGLFYVITVFSEKQAESSGPFKSNHPYPNNAKYILDFYMRSACEVGSWVSQKMENL